MRSSDGGLKWRGKKATSRRGQGKEKECKAHGVGNDGESETEETQRNETMRPGNKPSKEKVEEDTFTIQEQVSSRMAGFLMLG